MIHIVRASIGILSLLPASRQGIVAAGRKRVLRQGGIITIIICISKGFTPSLGAHSPAGLRSLRWHWWLPRAPTRRRCCYCRSTARSAPASRGWRRDRCAGCPWCGTWRCWGTTGGGNKGDKVNINEPTKQVHRHRAQTHRHQCSPICGDTHADTHRNGPHGLKTISIILKSVN